MGEGAPFGAFDRRAPGATPPLGSGWGGRAGRHDAAEILRKAPGAGLTLQDRGRKRRPDAVRLSVKPTNGYACCGGLSRLLRAHVNSSTVMLFYGRGQCPERPTTWTEGFEWTPKRGRSRPEGLRPGARIDAKERCGRAEQFRVGNMPDPSDGQAGFGGTPSLPRPPARRHGHSRLGTCPRTAGAGPQRGSAAAARCACLGGTLAPAAAARPVRLSEIRARLARPVMSAGRVVVFANRLLAGRNRLLRDDLPRMGLDLERCRLRLTAACDDEVAAGSSASTPWRSRRRPYMSAAPTGPKGHQRSLPYTRPGRAAWHRASPPKSPGSSATRALRCLGPKAWEGAPSTRPRDLIGRS